MKARLSAAGALLRYDRRPDRESAVSSMSDKSRPTVIGFDMPSAYGRLRRPGETTAIALLSCQPTQQWIDVFTRVSGPVEGQAAWTEAVVCDATIEFSNPAPDTRAFFRAVRALVERVSADAYIERVAHRPANKFDTATSFDRTD